MVGSGLLKAFLVEGMRAARQKSALSAREAIRERSQHIDKAAVTRGDVARVAGKVEELRGDVHAAFTDTVETVRASTDHLTRQIGILSETVGEHSKILKDLIEILTHLH